MGFMNGSTACILCIEEMVKTNQHNAKSIHDRILEALPDDQQEDLEEATEISALVTNSSESLAVLRFVVSLAMRSHKTIEDVLSEITQSGSVKSILWRGF